MHSDSAIAASRVIFSGSIYEIFIATLKPGASAWPGMPELRGA
jgi:hypothetical protein